ncbi:Sulfatase [uncultured archaeon]|nr:Sulfatase [uncultured archaeon]
MGRLNVTIIVMDTLRLDTFNELIAAAPLSRLGRFVCLDRCIAPSPWTLPSHASLLTGMYPSEHGSHESKTVKGLDIDRIRLTRRTMVSDLKDMGYRTYAISANPYVHPVYGFDEFDSFREESYFTDIYGSVFEVSDKVKPLLAKYRQMYGSNPLKISLALLKEDPNLLFDAVTSGIFLTPRAAAKKLKAKLVDNWPLEKGGREIVRTEKRMAFKKPFFFLINLMEPHDPYVGAKGKDFNWATPFMKEKVDDALVNKWKRLYLKASGKGYRYVCEIVKDLVRRFGDDQLIIITADHGQAFNEHGFIGHGSMLYDEIVRVPFAVMLPKGFEEVKSNDYVSLVNVKDFVMAALDGDKKAMRKLYGKKVRTESFGIPAAISNLKGIDLKKVRANEKARSRTFGN